MALKKKQPPMSRVAQCFEKWRNGKLFNKWSKRWLLKLHESNVRLDLIKAKVLGKWSNRAGKNTKDGHCERTGSKKNCEENA